MVIPELFYLVPTYAKTHASLMSIAFVIIFPLGAWIARLVRSSKTVWLHASVQLIGWMMMIAGLAIGTRMATIIGRVRLVLDYLSSCHMGAFSVLTFTSSTIMFIPFWVQWW